MESRRTRNLPGGGLRPALAMLAGVSPAASLLGGMAHSRRILFLLCAVLACGTASASPRVPPWGVNLGYVDPAARPGENFFTFANGRWLRTAEIPADRPAAGVSLELTQLNEERLKSIIAELHTRADLTPEEQKLRDLYDTFTDVQQIEAKGLQPAA